MLWAALYCVSRADDTLFATAHGPMPGQQLPTGHTTAEWRSMELFRTLLGLLGYSCCLNIGVSQSLSASGRQKGMHAAEDVTLRAQASKALEAGDKPGPFREACCT